MAIARNMHHDFVHTFSSDYWEGPRSWQSSRRLSEPFLKLRQQSFGLRRFNFPRPPSLMLSPGFPCSQQSYSFGGYGLIQNIFLLGSLLSLLERRPRPERYSEKSGPHEPRSELLARII